MAGLRTQPGAARQRQASVAASSSPSKDMKKFMAEIEKQWRHVKVVAERQLAVASSPESVEITIPTLPQDVLLALMIHRAREEYQADSTFFRPGSNGEVLERDPGAPHSFVTMDRTVETVLLESLQPTRTSQRTPLSTTPQTRQPLTPTQPAIATLQPAEPTPEEDEKAWDILDNFVQRNGWVQVFDRFTIPQWRGIILRHLHEGAAVGSTTVAASQPYTSARAVASVQDSVVGVNPTGEIVESPIPPLQETTNRNQQRPARRFTSNANARSSYMDAYAARLNTGRTARIRASTRSIGTTYHPDGQAPEPSGNDQPRPSLIARLPFGFSPFDLTQDDATANSRKKRKRNTQPDQEQPESQPARKSGRTTARRSTTASSSSNQTSEARSFSTPGLPTAPRASIPHGYNPPATFALLSNRLKTTPRGPSTKISPTKDRRSTLFRDKTQQVHGTRKGFRTHGPPPHFDKNGGDQSAKLPFRYWIADRHGNEYLKEHHYKPSTKIRDGDGAEARARKESLRGGIDWANGDHMRLLNEWVNQILWRHGCPIVRADMREKVWSWEEDEAFRDVQREHPGASHSRCCRLYVERYSGGEMRIRNPGTGVVETRRVPVRTEQAVYSHAAAKKLWLNQSSRRSGAGVVTRTAGGGAPAAADDGVAAAQTAQPAQPAAEGGSAGSTQPAANAVEPAGAEPEGEWVSTDEEEVEDEDDDEEEALADDGEANAASSTDGM